MMVYIYISVYEMDNALISVHSANVLCPSPRVVILLTHDISYIAC